jgi:lipooligosaccharide transport system permease protein
MTVLTGTTRVFESELVGYRRTWRGSVISTFLQPILFLSAIGLGLGAQVDAGRGTESLPIPYLEFLGTGLLAAAAMQTGAGDGSWPIMAAIKWRKTYHARLATPITVAENVFGRVMFVTARLALMLTVYTIILALFGAIDIWPGVLGIPPAILTGLAFNAPVIAYTAQLESEAGLSSLFRYGIVPLFLFSGTFFPVSQLPDWLEPIAFLTPLWHGVELVRKLTLPDATDPVVSDMSMWVHVGFLVALVVAGLALAIRLMERRLKP